MSFCSVSPDCDDGTISPVAIRDAINAYFDSRRVGDLSITAALAVRIHWAPAVGESISCWAGHVQPPQRRSKNANFDAVWTREELLDGTGTVKPFMEDGLEAPFHTKLPNSRVKYFLFEWLGDGQAASSLPSSSAAINDESTSSPAGRHRKSTKQEEKEQDELLEEAFFPAAAKQKKRQSIEQQQQQFARLLSDAIEQPIQHYIKQEPKNEDEAAEMAEECGRNNNNSVIDGRQEEDRTGVVSTSAPIATPMMSAVKPSAKKAKAAAPKKQVEDKSKPKSEKQRRSTVAKGKGKETVSAVKDEVDDGDGTAAPNCSSHDNTSAAEHNSQTAPPQTCEMKGNAAADGPAATLEDRTIVEAAAAAAVVQRKKEGEEREEAPTVENEGAISAPAPSSNALVEVAEQKKQEGGAEERRRLPRIIPPFDQPQDSVSCFAGDNTGSSHAAAEAAEAPPSHPQVTEEAPAEELAIVEANVSSMQEVTVEQKEQEGGGGGGEDERRPRVIPPTLDESTHHQEDCPPVPGDDAGSSSIAAPPQPPSPPATAAPPAEEAAGTVATKDAAAEPQKALAFKSRPAMTTQAAPSVGNELKSPPEKKDGGGGGGGASSSKQLPQPATTKASSPPQGAAAGPGSSEDLLAKYMARRVARRDMERRLRTVRIDYIHESLTPEKHRGLFDVAGRVLKVRIGPKQSPDATYVHALVEYSTVAEAAAAIEQLHHRRVHKCRLVVVPAVDAISGEDPTDANENAVLCSYGGSSADVHVLPRRGNNLQPPKRSREGEPMFIPPVMGNLMPVVVGSGGSLVSMSQAAHIQRQLRSFLDPPPSSPHNPSYVLAAGKMQQQQQQQSALYNMPTIGSMSEYSWWRPAEPQIQKDPAYISSLLASLGTGPHPLSIPPPPIPPEAFANRPASVLVWPVPTQLLNESVLPEGTELFLPRILAQALGVALGGVRVGPTLIIGDIARIMVPDSAIEAQALQLRFFYCLGHQLSLMYNDRIVDADAAGHQALDKMWARLISRSDSVDRESYRPETPTRSDRHRSRGKSTRQTEKVQRRTSSSQRRPLDDDDEDKGTRGRKRVRSERRSGSEKAWSRDGLRDGEFI